ncbi:flagellar basal body P-ring biosynthesis protein FlgA [Rhabdaerophilaceae bacterium]
MIPRLLPLALAGTVVATVFGGQTFAQNGMRLKAEATISGDSIRLDQLVEGVGHQGQIAVFRAPQPGARGTIRADRIIQAAREIGLRDIEIGDVIAVQIIRPGRTISRDDMLQAISRAAAERGSLGSLDIVLDDHHAARIVDAGRGEAIKVGTFTRDQRSNRFEARLALAGGPEGQDAWTITGSIVEMREIAVPAGDIDRGEAIQAKDLVMIKRPASQVPADIVRPIGDLIGMVPRRALRAGEPVRAADLAKPILVEKSTLVSVTYSTRGLSLSMRGRAMGSGSQGDIVKVQNIQSKKVVEGIVTGPAQVTIAGPVAPQASLTEAAKNR